MMNFIRKLNLNVLKNAEVCIARHGYFIALTMQSKSVLLRERGENKRLSLNHYQVFNDSILLRNGLFIGRLSGKVFTKFNDEKLLNQYASELLRNQIILAKQFFAQIIEYLKIRISEGKTLTSHGVIKITVSELTEALCDMDLLYDMYKEVGGSEISSELVIRLQNFGQKLAFLFGGKSFLQESCIETFWLFSLINKIYLTN